MKKARMVIFALLVVVIIAMSFMMSQYETVLSAKDAKIEAIQGQLTKAETIILKQNESLKQKDEYITELYSSVDSLTVNLDTLEEKLNELSAFQSKLK